MFLSFLIIYKKHMKNFFVFLFLYFMLYVSTSANASELQNDISEHDTKDIKRFFSLQELSLINNDSSIIHLTIAIFNLTFQHPIKIIRENNKDHKENSLGLTRLICGHHLFDSYPPSFATFTTSSSLPFPIFFFPLSDKTQIPIYTLISSLFYFYNPNQISFALITSYKDHNVLSEEELSSCTISFLPITDQIFKPTGSYLINNQILSIPSPLSFQLSVLPAIINPGLDISYLLSLSSSLLPNAQNCESSHPDMVFLAESLTASVGGLGDLVGSVAKPVLAPISPVVGGMMSSSLGSTMGDSLARNLAGSYTDIISTELSESLGPALSQVLVPSLTETLTESLTSSLSTSLRNYLSFSLTKRITSELTSRITTTLKESIPQRVNTETPMEMAKELTYQLGHILTRSLSHTIIPSLIHTLTHSPLSDYYCYYCYHHKLYCNFCHLQPNQVYYSLYYASYYSSYISRYYSKYFADGLAKQLKEEEIRRHEHMAEKNKYEIVYSTDPESQTPSP